MSAAIEETLVDMSEYIFALVKEPWLLGESLPGTKNLSFADIFDGYCMTQESEQNQSRSF